MDENQNNTQNQPQNQAPAPNSNQPAQNQAQQQTQNQLQQNIQQAKQEQLLALKKKKKRRGFLTGCLSLGFGALVLIFFGFLIFASQTRGGIKPLLDLFGIDEATLINTLIDLTHIGFGIFTFVTFIITLIGLFKLGLAKKEDKSSRTKGWILALVGGFLFLMMIFLWVTAYLALSSKRIVPDNPVEVIITNPQNTLGLTAPASIEFEAADLNYDQNKFTLLSYSWDFGDDEQRNGQSVIHEYQQKGPNNGGYTVILTVTYKNNDTAEKITEEYTKEVVFVNERVVAKFSFEPKTGQTPLTVNFDATESKDPDGKIISYEWDFNDDNDFDEASGETTSYIFEKIGKFKVKLRVTDDNEEFDVAEDLVEVTESASIKAVIDVDNDNGNFLAGKNYIFDGGKSASPEGLITEYEWNFGDNTQKATTRTAGHVFEKTGTYLITLKVKDENGAIAETDLEAIVKPAEASPIAVITTNPAAEEGQDLEGDVPFTVNFSAKNSTDGDNNIVDYEWDFDQDGNTDKLGDSAAYTFDQVGEYLVKLTVTDAQNQTSTASTKVLVKEQGLYADLKANQVTGEVPLKVTLDASGSRYPGGEIISYQWDFGDGTAERISESRITHEYTQVGSYTAKVTVIGSDGSQASDTIQLIVRSVAVTACFEPNILKGQKPLKVTFDPSCSRGAIVSYRWDFGDGTISRERKPTYIFESAGIYTVKLEVSDAEGVFGSFSEQIIVTGAVR